MNNDSFGNFIDRCAIMYIIFFIIFFIIRLAIQIIVWLVKGIVFLIESATEKR